MCPTHAPENPDRRGFLTKALAAVIGGIVGLFPALAGLTVILDPLRRKTQASGLARVASLDALPNDGVPRKFRVVADRQDAWNKFNNVPVGAVYLRRTGEKTVEAYNVVCPHAGCFVDYMPERKSYLCPCHNSTFAVDGKMNDPKSPSPRGLDTLEVEVRDGGEIWVKFQNFQAGHKEKVPVA
jgi:menaquinol-cytochrome c reductase iron-sulfur subunit